MLKLSPIYFIKVYYVKKLLLGVCSLMLSISIYANDDNIQHLIDKAKQDDAKAQNDLGVYYLMYEIYKSYEKLQLIRNNHLNLAYANAT